MQPTLNVNLVYSGPIQDATPYIYLFQDLNPVYVDKKEATWDALPWATYNGYVFAELVVFRSYHTLTHKTSYRCTLFHNSLHFIHSRSPASSSLVPENRHADSKIPIRLNNILCTPTGWARFPLKNFYAANVKAYDIPTMRDFFDSWREMNEKWDGQAMFSVMFESFPQQGVRERNDDATAYPWRHGADHFL